MATGRHRWKAGTAAVSVWIGAGWLYAPFAFSATPYEVKDRLLTRFATEVPDSRHDTVDVIPASDRVWLVGESTSKKRIAAYLRLAEETASGFEVVNRVKKVDGYGWDPDSKQTDGAREGTREFEACEALAPAPETPCLWPTRIPRDGLRGYALSPQGRRAIEALLEGAYSRGIDVGLPWRWRVNAAGAVSGFAPHLVAPAVRLRVRNAVVRVKVGNGLGGRPEIRLEGPGADRSLSAGCRREGPIAGTVFVDCSALDDPEIQIVLGVSTGLSIEAEKAELHLTGAPAYLSLKAVQADLFAELPEEGSAVRIESVMKPGSIATPDGYRRKRSRGTRSYEWITSRRSRYGLLFGRVFVRAVQVGTVTIHEVEPEEAFPARSHWQAFPQHRVKPRRELIDRATQAPRPDEEELGSDFSARVERIQVAVRTSRDTSLPALLESGKAAVEIDGRRIESAVIDEVSKPPELLVVLDGSGSMRERSYELAARALEELDGEPVISTAIVSGGQVVVMTRRADKRAAAEAIRNAPTPMGTSLIREAAVLSVDLARAVDLPLPWRLVLVTDLVTDDEQGFGRISGGMVRRALAETPASPVVLVAPDRSRPRDRQLGPAPRGAGATFLLLSERTGLQEELEGERYLLTFPPPAGRRGWLRLEIRTQEELDLDYRREIWAP